MQRYRITMPTKFYVAITMILTLPPLGGIVQLASFKSQYFDALHLACIAPYFVYFAWLRLYMKNGISISGEEVVIRQWMKEARYALDGNSKVGEVEMPAQNYITGRYEYMAHFYIHRETSMHLICAPFIEGYHDLKRIIEENIGGELKVVKIENESPKKNRHLLAVLFDVASEA